MLRRRLRDERYRDTRALECTERTRRNSRHADHAVPGDRQQCLIGDCRERFHRAASAPSRRLSLTLDDDLCAVRGGIGVRTDDQPRSRLQRNQRARVQDLGAVVGELRCFPDVEHGNQSRVGNDAGIRRQQAGDILPKNDIARAQHAAEQSGGEIGATAPKGDDFAPRRAADEPGDHGHDTAMDDRAQKGFRCVRRLLDVGARVPVWTVGAHHISRFHELRDDTAGGECCSE